MQQLKLASKELSQLNKSLLFASTASGGVQGGNIRISYIFMGNVHFPESRFEAEVYKFKGFTVNLFINKGFDQLTA